MLRRSWIPQRRDIIWIDCNPQAGREMRDVHPLLVLSPAEFNERTGIVIGLPMTTAEYNRSNPFAIRIEGPRRVTSFVLSHQPKSFDWRVRRARPHPWRRASAQVFQAACDSLNQIVQIAT
jgi:mRNA interferase MazF